MDKDRSAYVSDMLTLQFHQKNSSGFISKQQNGNLDSNCFDRLVAEGYTSDVRTMDSHPALWQVKPSHRYTSGACGSVMREDDRDVPRQGTLQGATDAVSEP